MENAKALMRVVDNPAIDQVAQPLSRAVRGAYDAAGPAGQRAKNALHGVWLGHPLHPVFTDLPLGAWTTALVTRRGCTGRSGNASGGHPCHGCGTCGRGRRCRDRTDGLERNRRSTPPRRAHSRFVECDGDGALRNGVRATAQGLARWRTRVRLDRLHDRGRCRLSRRRSRLSSAYRCYARR